MGRNPRVIVTLDPEEHDALARVARYTGTSMSALVGQMVKEASPVLRQLADTLEEANGLSLKLSGALAAKLEGLSRVAQELEHGSQEVLDSIQEQAAEKREEQGERPRLPVAGQGKTL